MSYAEKCAAHAQGGRLVVSGTRLRQCCTGAMDCADGSPHMAELAPEPHARRPPASGSRASASPPLDRAHRP